MTISNETIQQMLARPPVVGRLKHYADQTGYPERLPDECPHQPQDLIIMPDGQIECYACGCRPPGIYRIERS